MQGRILRVLDVDVRVASRFTMNLLTGRVIQHRCGPVNPVGSVASGPEVHSHRLGSDLANLCGSLHDLPLCTCRDRWDLSRSSIPAQAAVTALRAGWAARQKAADLSEDSSGLMDRLAPQDNGMDIQGCAAGRNLGAPAGLAAVHCGSSGRAGDAVPSMAPACGAGTPRIPTSSSRTTAGSSPLMTQ